MGKSLCYYKSYLIIFLFIVILPDMHVYALSNEFELFDRAYEYYLSYQPEKAVEDFTLFIKEFTDSSARDAALFWLGKAFTQLQLNEEAKKIFNEIIEKYPQSPFMPFVRRELDDFEKKEDFKKKSSPELNELKKKLKEKDKELKDLKEENSKLKETENSLNELLKQKDKKNEELINTLNKCKEETKKIVQQINAAEENILLKSRLKEYEYRESYIKQSSSVLQTLGIKDSVWRTGNAYEDMENEQILLKMAEILKIIPDIKQYKNLMENHIFNQVQSDYLNKFIILSNLIDFRLKQLPEEKMVEILKVRFSDSKFDKTKLAAKLQTDAIKGKSFFDISQSYPEDVEYSEIPHEVLQDSLKKKIQQLRDGQVGVIWSEEGYLIIKKRMKKLSYNPFQEIRPEITEKIKNQVRLWIDEYRSITKD